LITSILIAVGGYLQSTSSTFHSIGLVCSAKDGLRLISNFHSTTIGRQFLTRTVPFAAHYGTAMGGPSVKVLAPRVIFGRFVHPSDWG